MTTLVVGVDGSPDSLAALRWAAAAAGPAGTVVVVHGFSAGDELVLEALQSDSARRRRQIGELMAGGWAAVAAATGSTVRSEVHDGEAEHVLLEVAGRTGADAVVVGAHGRRPAVPRSLGHRVAALVRHTDRPLVVVRDGQEGSAPAGATVAVGAGHGRATQAALHWAAAWAGERGLHLRLVRAVGRPPLGPEGLVEVLARTIDPAMPMQWAREDLAELAEGLQREFGPQMVVDWEAEGGLAGSSLVDASRDAVLLVVGRRHRPIADRLVGGSLHHVLTHASCPVVVVPAVDGA